MQIRELNLKELEDIFTVLKQLRSQLSYKEFEDLIYDMRHMEYKMFGIIQDEKLVTYAGVSVQTNLYHKRHLFIFDFVTDESERKKGYGKLMLEYLEDYSRVAMCENIVLSSSFIKEKAHRFYNSEGFIKKSFVFIKKVETSL